MHPGRHNHPPPEKRWLEGKAGKRSDHERFTRYTDGLRKSLGSITPRDWRMIWMAGTERNESGPPKGNPRVAPARANNPGKNLEGKMAGTREQENRGRRESGSQEARNGRGQETSEFLPVFQIFPGFLASRFSLSSFAPS